MSRSEKIQVSTEEGVREIVIARPETKNSLLVTMYEALTEALLDAERDPEVQVILVRGEGGQFSSGKSGHGSAKGLRRDARKGNAAQAKGWRLCVLTSDMVTWEGVGKVLEQMRVQA